MAPRALNAILVSFNFVSVNCFSKSKREHFSRARAGSCVKKATAKLKSQTIHFQKKMIFGLGSGAAKIIFLKRENGNLINFIPLWKVPCQCLSFLKCIIS